MAFERIVALHVKDDASYAKYREEMVPILKNYGGGFRYDFKIAEVLKSEAGHPINRVFAIFFRDETAMRGFFADPAYSAIRARFFDPAVGPSTQIAGYERNT